MDVIEKAAPGIWRFYALNNLPLFVDQKQIILRLKFKNETLYGSPYYPFKFYYIFRTIKGNIPTLENVTQDFLGSGIPFEEYPKWGELVFNDYYDPERFSH